MLVAEVDRESVETEMGQDTRANSLGLSEIVQSLLRAPDIDAVFLDQRGAFGSFLDRLFGSLERAFLNNDADARLDVHRALQVLYEEEIGPVRPGVGLNQDHPLVVRVRNEIERAWERFELERIKLSAHDVPTNSKGFLDFLRACCAEHRLTNHPLFDYLEREAPREAIIEFFLHEAPVALRFCDLIVLSMVGADEEIRRELADNFWDEVGSGNYQNRHTELYRRLLRYVGKEPPSSCSLVRLCAENYDWRALAGYNMYLYLALHRRNHFRSVGSLGVAEMMDPAQYEKIVRGCYRVGLTDDHQLAYYVDHIVMDKEHGDGWFDHVMAPLIRKYPEAAYDMAVGAVLRMNSGTDYYDSLLEKLPYVASDSHRRRAA